MERTHSTGAALVSNLQALLERVEKAEGPDGELSRCVVEVVEGKCTHRETSYYCIEDGNDSDSGFECVACGKDTYGESWPPYTASIDAAVGLVEKMLPGWTWGINGPDPELDGECVGSLWKSTANTIDGDGKTPALALIAALLKALISQSNPERPGVE